MHAVFLRIMVGQQQAAAAAAAAAACRELSVGVPTLLFSPRDCSAFGKGVCSVGLNSAVLPQYQPFPTLLQVDDGANLLSERTVTEDKKLSKVRTARCSCSMLTELQRLALCHTHMHMHAYSCSFSWMADIRGSCLPEFGVEGGSSSQSRPTGKLALLPCDFTSLQPYIMSSSHPTRSKQV